VGDPIEIREIKVVVSKQNVKIGLLVLRSFK
jgi:hypothetical protein